MEESPIYMEVKITTDEACVFGFSVIGGASITIAAKGGVSLKKAIEKLDLAGKYIKKAENAYEQYKIDEEKYEGQDNTTWERMTSKESQEAANKLEFEKINYRAKNDEPIYYNKKIKTYISQNIGSAHGSGLHNDGVWK